MGRVLLCTGKYAENPYCFENICVNIYSVEELCYLLSTNPFMINADIMDRALAEWLDTECGLPELSHELLTLLNRASQPGIFVDTILDFVNYSTEKDRKRIEEVLRDNIGLSEFERQKKQGDYLVKNGRYRLALTEYDKILLELPEAEAEIRAGIYHNMGVAHGRLFEYESAARSFKKAYELSGNEESGIQYLVAVRSQLSDGKYISFIAENGQYYELSLKVEKLLEAARGQFEASEVSRMLSALQFYREEGNTASYYEDIDKMIAKLKEDYRSSVTK